MRYLLLVYVLSFFGCTAQKETTYIEVYNGEKLIYNGYADIEDIK